MRDCPDATIATSSWQQPGLSPPAWDTLGGAGGEGERALVLELGVTVKLPSARRELCMAMGDLCRPLGWGFSSGSLGSA